MYLITYFMGQINRSTSLLMVIVAVLIWGISFIWTKQLIEIINSTVLIFLRMAIASTLLVGIGIATKRIDKIARKDYKEIILLGFIQPFLYFLFEVESVKESSPTLIALMMAQIPLLVAIVSSIMMRKWLPVQVIMGIVLSIFGVGLLLLGGGDATLMTTPYGAIMGIAATFCAVCYAFLTKRLVDKYSPYTVTTYIHIVALILFTPLVVIFESESLTTIPMTIEVLYPLLSLGVLCSAVAFMFFSYGIKNLGVVTASMLNNLCPAVTAIGVFMILGDTLAWLQIVGVGVSITGLMLGVLKR